MSLSMHHMQRGVSYLKNKSLFLGKIVKNVFAQNGPVAAQTHTYKKSRPAGGGGAWGNGTSKPFTVTSVALLLLF
jgi:hypothetical protein